MRSPSLITSLIIESLRSRFLGPSPVPYGGETWVLWAGWYDVTITESTVSAFAARHPVGDRRTTVIVIADPQFSQNFEALLEAIENDAL